MNAFGTATPATGETDAPRPGTWAVGDYSVIGSTLQIVGESLAESVGARPGSRVLDVAAGNGNATLAFARRWHRVVSTDSEPSLLGAGAARARAEGLEVEFRIADAERLPFGDGAFDAVVSTFGVMFAKDRRRAAAELVRVCRSGGTIGLANWTPGGFVGEFVGVIGRYREAGNESSGPCAWGDASWLSAAFGDVVSEVRAVPKSFVFRYRDPDHFLGVFRRCYGPLAITLDRLDGIARREALRDLRDLVSRHNAARDGSLEIHAAYLEATLTR